MAMSDLLDYTRLIADIMKVSVFRHRRIWIMALCCMLVTVLSTYYVIKISSCAGEVTKAFKTPNFENALRSFLFVSTVALCLKFVPIIVFTYFLQDIMRREFLILLRRYIEQPYAAFHKKSAGEMRYCLFMKSTLTPMCAQTVVFELARMAGNTVFSMVKIHGELSIGPALIFAAVPAVYLFSVLYFIHARTSPHKNMLGEQEKISSLVYDKLINYDVIKTYNLENSESESLYSAMGPQTDAHVKLGKFTSDGFYLLNYLLYAPFILVLFLGLRSATMTSDVFFSLAILYIMVADNLDTLGRQLIMLFSYLVQVKFADTDVAPPESSGADKEDIGTFNSSIEYRGVTIYYGDCAIISDINLSIKRGEKVAVVGPNGTGKSTFIKSLLGFIKFDGDLLIDGRSTQRLTWKSILRQISYVPQEDYTSDDTVINNLRLGRKGATDEYIIGKAREFGAHNDFIALPEGYETQAGPRGNRLSGGQLQKISLVRAAVKDAPIFILDEATAAMDKSFENALIQGLLERLADRTIIMIVHGREYLPMFDRLLFFNNGKLEQAGHYDELCRTNENFKAFIDH